MQSRDPDLDKNWAKIYEAFSRSTISLDKTKTDILDKYDAMISEIRIERTRIDLYHILDTGLKEEENEKDEIKIPQISWPYWFMPHDRIDDALAGLAEAYVNHILPTACNGDERKARRIFYWQAFLIVAGHHENRIKTIFASILGLFGLGKIMDLWKS